MPESRRERPAKPPLTREGIVAEALAILRAGGLAKVTMRRIAEALDTGPASLYVYVRDTEDLHAQLLDALLEPLAGKRRGDWRTRLKALLEAYGRILFDHPDIARMALSTQPSGPHYLRLVDTILGLLHEGGIPLANAAWAVDILLLLPTAVAAERTARRPGQSEAEMSALAVHIANASANDYPNIARAGDDLLSGPGPERLDWALDVILAGAPSAPRKKHS